jgi:hypothetical protein
MENLKDMVRELPKQEEIDEFYIDVKTDINSFTVKV